MLDTEMSREDHIHRLLANMSDIEINDISIEYRPKRKRAT